MIEQRRRDVGTIQTTHLFDMVVDLEDRLDMGHGPIGRRVLNRVRRGSFAGPRLRGELIPGGGDWALFRADGVMAVDARVTLRTDDGSLIHMTYGGRLVIPEDVRPLLTDLDSRHEIEPARNYFRTSPLFETGAPAYAWLNEIVAVGYGYLVEGGGVAYQVSAVL